MFPHPNEVHDRMSEYGTPQHRPGHRSMNKPPSSHSYRPEYSANQHRFHLWGNIKIPIWSTDLVNKTNSTIFFTHYNNFIALYPQTHTPTLTICLIMSIWMYYVYINNKNFFFFLTFLFFISSWIVFKCVSFIVLHTMDIIINLLSPFFWLVVFFTSKLKKYKKMENWLFWRRTKTFLAMWEFRLTENGKTRYVIIRDKLNGLPND